MKHTEERTGFAHAVTAYALWGLFPLYFTLFQRSTAFEVVAHRIVWSLVFCLLVLAATRGLDQLGSALADRRAVLVTGVSGLLIGVNWTLYVHGVNTGRTLEAAIGYFITPLVTTALGVLVLRERLRRAQWIAVGLGGTAMLVLVAGHDRVPWIALGVAASFGIYGLLKKRTAIIRPVPGLILETTALLPLALFHLVQLGLAGQASAPLLSWYGVLLTTTGVVTAVPLLLFASAAHRIPLVVVGMIQYMAPLLQFLLGWLVFREPLPLTRWVGFLLIWAAVVVFVTDAVRHSSQLRRTG